jgi:hypothetical protein
MGMDKVGQFLEELGRGKWTLLWGKEDRGQIEGNWGQIGQILMSWLAAKGRGKWKWRKGIELDGQLAKFLNRFRPNIGQKEDGKRLFKCN